MADDDYVFAPGTGWDMIDAPSLFGARKGYWYQVGDVKVSEADGYWGDVLFEARRIYGDGDIGFAQRNLYNADGTTGAAARRLVFGDGANLPVDGRVAYSVPQANGSINRYVQNHDGTVQLIDRSGRTTGPPIRPDLYRYDPETRQVVASKGGVLVYSAPVSKMRGPDGKTGWALGPDGRLSRLAGGGSPVVPGAEILTNRPQFPGWVLRDNNPTAEAITRSFVTLRSLLGSGTPAQAKVSPAPYAMPTDPAGIKEYQHLKESFDQLSRVYGSVAEVMAKAVSTSAALTEAAREEIETAVAEFSVEVSTVPEPDINRVWAIASASLSRASAAVQRVQNNQGRPGIYSNTAAVPNAATTVRSVKPIPDQPPTREKPVDWGWDRTTTGAAIASGSPDLMSGTLGDVAKATGAAPAASAGGAVAAASKFVPIVGTVIGATLGSAVDIKSGVPATKAIVTNTAGGVAGLALGTGTTVAANAAMGAMIGSVVPGVGTALGVVVAVGVGFLVTKKLQDLW